MKEALNVREIFGVKFYMFDVISRCHLGYCYKVHIGHVDEANKIIHPIAYLYNNEEKWQIYKLKVLFLVVRKIETEPEDIGILAKEEGGRDICFAEFGEYTLLTPYELDDNINRLISQEGFVIHFVY